MDYMIAQEIVLRVEIIIRIPVVSGEARRAAHTPIQAATNVESNLTL